ncbi:MAG: cell division protein ZapE [Rickettsiales bacterium]
MAIAYEAALARGPLLRDAAQATLVAQLSQLQQAWSAEKEGGLLAKLFSKAETGVQGAYIWGGVGRGKSLLMDMFFDTIPLESKHRVHFHAFMLDVHARIHTWREANRDDLKEKDPIPPLAKALAAEAKLLCLDEMQVHDIADAMILSRLFTLLFDAGVKVVFTSNRVPDDLYLHGLQRDRFEKFIGLVHERCEVIELKSAEDYRLKQLQSLEEVYFVGQPKHTRPKMDAAFAKLIHEAAPKSKTESVQGHALPIPAYYGDVARFSFHDLCAQARGAGDYLFLAQEFGTIMLDDIPELNPEKRNEAKRFVTLIDALYEHKVKFICSASKPPEKLYPTGDGSFEFGRTVSRLKEMQSETYLASSHVVE